MIIENRDTFREFLHKNILEVTFNKDDGSQRVMKCTLDPNQIHQVESEDSSKTQRKTNPDVIAVWDIEKEGWRSFRWDSVKRVQLNGIDIFF
jgi:patatin-like phospholipase/acyl hydrolase